MTLGRLDVGRDFSILLTHRVVILKILVPNFLDVFQAERLILDDEYRLEFGAALDLFFFDGPRVRVGVFTAGADVGVIIFGGLGRLDILTQVCKEGFFVSEDLARLEIAMVNQLEASFKGCVKTLSSLVVWSVHRHMLSWCSRSGTPKLGIVVGVNEFQPIVNVIVLALFSSRVLYKSIAGAGCLVFVPTRITFFRPSARKVSVVLPTAGTPLGDISRAIGAGHSEAGEVPKSARDASLLAGAATATQPLEPTVLFVSFYCADCNAAGSSQFGSQVVHEWKEQNQCAGAKVARSQHS